MLIRPLRWGAWIVGLALWLALLPAAPLAAQIDPAANAGDWTRVQAAQTLVVGTSADYEPFAFYNSDFQLDGFDIALIQEMAERMGVRVVIKDFAFNGLLDALRLGQVDVAIGAISVTPDRQQLVDFSNFYHVGRAAVLVGTAFSGTIESAQEFAGLVVGVETGTTYQAWMQQNVVEDGIIPQANLRPYDGLVPMLRDLRNGTIDAVLLGELTARVEAAKFDEIKVGGVSLIQQRFAIAARKGSSLIDPLNDALLNVQADGTFATLVENYLNVLPHEIAPTPEDVVVNPPAPEAPPAEEANKAPAPCIDGMEFVADLNLDDLNMTAPPVVSAGRPFVKSWRVRNSGSCTWDAGYQLVFINGNRAEARMGGEPTSVGGTVIPGATTDINVSLVAPTTYGVFQGFWQMRNATGQQFGQVVWVGVTVPDPNPPTPTPVPATPPPAGLDPNLRADSTWISVGQCTTLRWNVENVSAVFLIDGGSQQGVGGNDARSVCPTRTTTYVLRVYDRGNQMHDFGITINVTGTPPPTSGTRITAFTVNNNRVRLGDCARLTWRTESAQGINLYRGGSRIVSSGAANGEHSDCPNQTGGFDYRVEAFGNGNDSRTLHVEVYSSGSRPRDE